MYQNLKKIFHKDSEEAEIVYQQRYNDPSSTLLGLRSSANFFYWTPPDVYKKILEAERINKKIELLALKMPPNAIMRYEFECMLDEIILTNDIEGVISTRKEIESALTALKENDKRLRFQGIVNKYNSLMLDENIDLSTCKDIRNLYDDLVLDEVVLADPKKRPDGKLFRKDSVRVVDAAQRIIHENFYSENQIIRELSAALYSFNDKEIEPLIRTAVFHFVFAYIHPFYDGNGRMNRFISSYIITKEFSKFAGLRLSFSVKENINEYYNAFSLVEHPLNRGDVTPFILSFLDIVIDALQKTYDALNEKNAMLSKLQEKMTLQFNDDPDIDVELLGNALLQGSLFTAKGLNMDEIIEDTHLSAPTIHKRLKAFKNIGLLIRKKSGRYAYYSIDVAKIRS